MPAGRLTKEQRERLQKYREKIDQEKQEREHRSQPFLELPLPTPREAPHRREEEPDAYRVIVIDI